MRINAFTGNGWSGYETINVEKNKKGQYQDDNNNTWAWNDEVGEWLATEEAITVTCYRQTETMTRKAALAKFLDCMQNSEGAEQSRYVKVYCGLCAGLTNVSDGGIS